MLSFGWVTPSKHQRKKRKITDCHRQTLRFRRPTPQNTNHKRNKDLQQAANGAYKPAYKNNPKTGENQPENLPDDLAEIVAVWPKLPEHIKQAIKALVGLTDNPESK
jgi:hypothetical protein